MTGPWGVTVEDGTVYLIRARDDKRFKIGELGADAVETVAGGEAWPVGSIFTSARPGDPGKRLGGTWKFLRSGRLPVGLNMPGIVFMWERIA